LENNEERGDCKTEGFKGGQKKRETLIRRKHLGDQTTNNEVTKRRER